LATVDSESATASQVELDFNNDNNYHYPFDMFMNECIMKFRKCILSARDFEAASLALFVLLKTMRNQDRPARSLRQAAKEV